MTPTYDEGENIEDFLRRTRAAVPEADILVVDDASPDGTADIAERVGAEVANVHVLRRSAKEGLGTAYRAGFGFALAQGYDVVCYLDADLSHDPGALPALLARFDADDADLVVGSRYVPGGSIPSWTWLRRAVSRLGNEYARALLGMPVRDSTSGYRVYRASALRAIDYATTRADGYGFQIEMAYRIWSLGGRVSESPIAFTDRVRGTSKMSFTIAGEALALVTWWAVRDRSRRIVGRLRGRRETVTAGRA
jgi:glycosyltransferase involved in cell wall biosynthesis